MSILKGSYPKRRKLDARLLEYLARQPKWQRQLNAYKRQRVTVTLPHLAVQSYVNDVLLKRDQ